MTRYVTHRRQILCLLVGFSILTARGSLAAPPGTATYASLPEKKGCVEIYLHKQVDLPAGKIVRAWTALGGTHEFVLYVNGKEACRTRYGRVASAFRRAEEIEDLAKFFRTGTNSLAVKVRRWSAGSPDFYMRAEVQIDGGKGIVSVPIATDGSWGGSYVAPPNWAAQNFKPAGWQAVKTRVAGRISPRIPRDKRKTIVPDIPVPLSKAVVAMFPRIGEMSDWRQEVVWRDIKADTNRLKKLFKTQFVAEAYARAIQRANTRMGDTFNISGYPVGNGIVFTTIGPWPFHNTTWTLGPEYQYPAQWNAGSTFAGDAVGVMVGGKPVALEDQWMWKIRRTDVVVTAAADRGRTLVLYTITFAPPKLKALLRIYAVANISKAPLKNVLLVNAIHRAKSDGRTLTETVKHIPVADAKGETNTRTMITGVLDELEVKAGYDEKHRRGSLKIHFGDIAPGESGKCLLHHITFLATSNGKPVKSDAEQTLATIKKGGYKLLDDTIRYWRDYNNATTTLEAPGAWGRRVTDFIDDVKMLVQVQQFERTGAVGPMWFFSDQWIRDACGPVKSFLRTGRLDNARRVLDYHYLSSIASRKILNWLPMDVDIHKTRPPVDDWSKITMRYADRHATCEVPSWVVLQHHWYFRFSGDTKTIADHWEYLKRCFYGQFDNPTDKVSRPDFKIPFHGDETYIYSGGEALWHNRYDLQQTSYPGGNLHSADSSFELAAAGDALVEMGKAIGKKDDADKIAKLAAAIRKATEKYYWMDDMGFYAQGMSVLFDGQLNRYPMANINANVIWSGYGDPRDKKTISNVLRMTEYLSEESGVFAPIAGYDVSVGMLQGQCLHSLAAINHPWAEKAFYALLMIAGDTTEFSEWMAPGPDFRTMYRANRIRPWEAGINLDAMLYYLSGFEPDAFSKRMTLTPRLPTGAYCPIKWDRMKLQHLPMGNGHFGLSVTDAAHGNKRRRIYSLVSQSKDDVSATLNAIVPFAGIRNVTVMHGKARVPTARVEQSRVFQQALATITAPLPAGKTLNVVVDYAPQPPKPLRVKLKTFKPTKPKFGTSDIVLFTATRPTPNRKLLRNVLAKDHKVLAVDATLPTDPETFEAALLAASGLRTRMLILNEGTMASAQRKPTFWWNPRFDEIIGKFLRSGGVVLEASSRNTSSKWLEKTLAPAAFEVNYKRGGDVLAMDTADAKLDGKFRWIDEKQAEACGKWSGYWAGNYTMRYLGGGPAITDRVLIWGTQEQPHGCMQYTMKVTPGKDHLIRIRTWPWPKKGFTLQVMDKQTRKWKVIETIWVPQPKDRKQNGWTDVFMTLPGKHLDRSPAVFRIGQPEGSSGGIGHANYRSTGAARIWLRDSLDKPPSMGEIATSSALAGRLGLPDKAVVAYSSGRIKFSGFAAPYRILGDSKQAALILRPVGKGLYVKSELTTLFPVEKMVEFIETLLDRSARNKALNRLKIAE